MADIVERLRFISPSLRTLRCEGFAEDVLAAASRIEELERALAAGPAHGPRRDAVAQERSMNIKHAPCLAYIRGNLDGNDGRVVTVHKHYEGDHRRDPGQWWVCSAPSRIKVIQGSGDPGKLVCIHDDCLVPIDEPDSDTHDPADVLVPVEVVSA